MFRGSFRATSGGGGGGSSTIGWQAVSAGSAQPFPLTSVNNGATVDVSAGPVAVQLPAAAGVAGEVFSIKHSAGVIATNSITISSAAGTIDGQATLVMTQSLSTTRVSSDGTNWLII